MWVVCAVPWVHVVVCGLCFTKVMCFMSSSVVLLHLAMGKESCFVYGLCYNQRPGGCLWSVLWPETMFISLEWAATRAHIGVHEACCSEGHVACDVIGLCAAKCSHDVCGPHCRKGSCWCLWSILWPEMMLRSSTDCKNKKATFTVVSMIEESHLRKRNIEVFCENFFAHPIPTPNNVIT